mmetsp:Transcript_5874/g.17627  ORF Transcript_5874/g.17627 Transcript_5874/m.17627 type:complete len:199 (+) Transcript_5874:46-642(+)
MGRAKKTRKFAEVKRRLNPSDVRLKTKELSKKKAAPVVGKESDEAKLAATPTPASMFFNYNSALGPPYHVILDTNFFNFSVKNKLDVRRAMLDCLMAPCHGCVTDCVMAELQKLGPKYKIALRIAKDKNLVRLPCSHKGTYADDCIVDRVIAHRVYIVATCDKDLKRRIRKVPGVPIMYISGHKYAIERLPDAIAPAK